MYIYYIYTRMMKVKNLNSKYVGIEVSTDTPKSKETRNEIFDTS